MESINSAKRQIMGTRLEMSKLCSFLGKEPWVLSANAAYNECSAPSVTVIVTLYNYSEYIQECLDSVCATVKDRLPGGFDVLVIDDCSTDKSASLVEEYIHQVDTPICLVKKVYNTGLADARNCGLNIARAPFVFILDADNWIYPNCLEVLYQGINESGCAAVYGIINCFSNKTGEGVGLNSFYEWDVCELLNGPYIDAMAMFKKDILLRLGGYSTELMLIAWSGWEDYDLWLNLAQSGYDAKLIPQILSSYRVHPTSMINTTNIYTDILAQYFRQKFVKLIEQHEDVDTVFGMPRHLEINTEDCAMVQLREARAMIEAMETSKFWKLRSRWFQIKNWVGITKT
ncbi:MAG: glycosyltransferase [Pleurocapsa minor HA4230-MV1]|jgi:glycosyltransferase involved in cell wall biosynthesis|nr:glycosyltransferase [Pleurocapsa minor HA4230-MV1]